MQGSSRVRAVVAGTALLGVVLSGCSVLQIRTADRDSGPVRVSVQKQAGQDPTSEPTDGPLPEGMERQTLSLGDDCPVKVSFAIGDDWTDASTTPSFHVFSRGTSTADNDVIIVSCSQAFDDSPQAVVDAKRKYSFAEQGSTVSAERTGTIGAGSFWSYQGVLGESEIFAINQKPTVLYGARIGYSTNGRLVDIGVEMRSLETDTAAAEDFRKMLPTVEVDGEKVPSPAFR